MIKKKIETENLFLSLYLIFSFVLIFATLSPNNLSASLVFKAIHPYTAIPAETDNKISLNLFSLIDDVKFAIQGRQTPFDDNDVVPLGFRTPSNGIYSIGIKSIDGLFETTAQAIFLHDLELNIIH